MPRIALIHALAHSLAPINQAIEAVKQRHAGMPVLKPNEAMIDEAAALALRLGGPVGLVASFGPTLASMPAEFPGAVRLHTALADGALAALDRGDVAAHDEAAVRAAASLVAQQGCVAIALAQFSLSRAAARVTAACGVPVLTTVDSAVRRLRLLLR